LKDHKNLKKARKAAGIKQQELTERLQVYQKDISRWENGERIPSIETLINICLALDVSSDELLGLDVKRKESLG
jgi:transcriptional regulator with XRE-family HTH domain